MKLRGWSFVKLAECGAQVDGYEFMLLLTRLPGGVAEGLMN